MTKIYKTTKAQREYSKKYKQLYPDKYKNQLLRIRFGITLEQYNKLVLKQNGVCAICGLAEVSIERRANKIRQLAVDHCHETGKIRGLLCRNCNIGLGDFKDDIKLLKKAISYLRKQSK